MGDTGFTINLKAIMDIDDVKHNVDQIQQKFNSLNISPKLKDTLNKDLNNFYKEYSKYTSKIEGGIKTQNQYNSAMKSLESMDKLYQKIGKDAEKIAGVKPFELFKDTPELANFTNSLAKMKAELANLKVDDSKITGPLNKIKELTTNTKAKGLVDALIGANAKGDFETVLAKAKELEVYTKRATAVMHDTTKAGRMSEAMQAVTNAIADTTKGAGDLERKIADTESQMNKTANSMSEGAKKAADGFRNSGKEVSKLTEDLKRIKTEEFGANQQIQMLDRQILRYFTLGQMIRKVADIAKQAWSTVKELDASMTQTAVVTNFSVGDMWDKLPMYTDTANQLGSTIKDVYDATTLYYQQGLNTNQAMGVATETLKMARIGGLQAAEATDMMTAALRGFNMQVNEMSAQRINDVYSKLAAITASNTQELGSAMTRTASIANSAGMQFETTSAFLAQMIETTREAPENLGTAMKTIVARFQEMKKAPEDLVDSEGELLDANRVEKALKTIGVALRDTNGDFRDLDQVFLEISAKWNTLSMGQQRYIATMAAGSRQQSRFIAMMGNHERVMELVNAANNSAGASEAQFNKTLDSMEAKLNQFHNAWNEFAMSMMNSSFAKGIVDAGTTILGVINKIVSVAGKIAPDPFKGITKSLVALTAVTGTFKLGGGLFGLVRTPLAKFAASTMGLKDDPYGITDMFTEISKDAKEKGAKIGQQLSAGIHMGIQQGTLQKDFTLDKLMGLKNINLSNYADQINSILNKQFADLGGNNSEVDGIISRITTAARNNRRDLVQQGLGELKGFGFDVKELDKIKLIDKDFNNITNSAARAGDSIYRFGAALQGTPLAPFGQMLMKAGSLLTTFSNGITGAIKNIVKFSKARARAMQHLDDNGMARHLSNDMNISNASIAIGLITAFVAAWIAGVQKIKEQEQELQTVAAGTSEAFSSAKQATSELKDKLDQLETSESAFDGLVAGSAEFEEKLADVNSKIDELIKMYPQLESLGYIKIDNNGLKSITQEGKDYILEYQKEIENTAGALNTLATGELNAQKKRKEANKVKMPTVKTERRQDAYGASRSFETEESKEARAPYLQEQENIKAEAETIKKTSRANAIKSVLTQEHLSSVENLTSIMAERYEDMSKQAEESLGDFSTHKKDYYEAYADALGYTYEGGELFNAQHEKVEVDEKTVKQGAIRALTISQIEVDAKALDSAFYEINSAAKKQLKISGEGSDSFISDIMGRNTEVNQKALEQSLKDNGKALKDFVDEMSDEEVALQVGVDLDTFKQDAKGYRKQLKDTLVQAASDTQNAVSKQYGDLGVMMLRAQGQTLVGAAASIDEGRGELTQVIQSKISELTAAQRSFATTVGQGLQENLGVDSMSIFMNQYIDANNKVKKEISSNLTDVDFSSSIETLGAFTKLSKSTTKEVQTLGKDLLNSADSAHLLGSAMEEVQTSESWAEVAKNMDKYVNSAGELDASGVEKMAAECGPLNDLLNTGAINASGFAMALDALEGSGIDSLSQINTSVLQLLSSFSSLDGVMANAHDTVANFDPGVDTGEVEDFMQENVDKIKEYMNNGEWGNAELQNRVKSIVGVDAWNKALKDSGGNFEKAIKSFNIGKHFKEGFDTAWDNISSGKGIKNGKLVDASEIEGLSKEIKGSWKYLGDGTKQWQLDIGDATTEQVVEWLQKVYDVNESTAEMMLTDFENYSGELKSKLQNNDLTATMKNGEFYENNTLEGTSTSVLSKSNLELLAKQTHQDYGKLVTKFEKYAERNDKTFKVFNNQNKKGELSTNWDVLNKRLSALAEGTKPKNQQDIYAWLKPFTQGKTIDVDKSMAQATQAGATDEQVQNMLYRAFRDLTSQGKEFEYNGETLDASEISTFDDFINKLSTIDQNAEWTQVGQAIASGYLDYIKSQEQPEQKRVNDFSDVGINGGEQERINEAQVELDAAFNNKDVAQGAAQLAQIKEQLELSGQAAGTLNEQFIALNAASLSQLSDTELLKVWESLGYGETEIDKIRAKLEGHPFVFETKLKGKSLEDHINKISLLTGKQREILLSTKISGAEKVDQFLEELYKTFGADTEVEKKAIIEATTKFATGDKEGGQQILKDAGFDEKDIPIIEQQLQVLYDGSIANPDQLKEGLNTQIDKVVDETEGEKKTIKKDVEVIGTYTVNNQQKGKKQKKEKAWNVTNTITTVVNGASDVLQLTGIIKKVPLRTLPKVIASVSGEGALTSLKNKLESLPLVKTVKTIYKKVTTKGKGGDDDWRGQGNTGAIPALPAGSLAKGTKKLGIGQIGPNGQGGPTLTGELGYEVAWLPSEGKSMIVGANGPQMIDLPKNAVVWNHEQSKKILKQKSIPIGSQANSATSKVRGSNGSQGTISVTKGGSSSKKENKSNSKRSNKYQEKIIKQTWKLLGTAGKISNWWEDISRQVEGIQRVADRNQKAFKKLIDTAGTTLSDVQKNSETYSKSLQKSIQLNEEIVKHYKDKLDALTSGKGQSAKSRKGAVSGINKAANEVTKAEAKVELAKQTKSKKDDKKTKKNLRNAKKRLKNAKKKDKSAAVDTVTYDDEIQVTTKKKTRKGKGKWKNKTVKKKKKVKSTRAVDWSKIIEYDAETDTWVLNDKEINKQAGGNKKAAKAIKEKGNKKIDEMIQRRNGAQDKIDSARESLNQLAEDVYQMFSRWEKSLTHVYLISQKLESLQKKTDIYDTQEEYLSTKALAGYNPFSQESLDKLNTILTNRQNSLVEQAKAQKDLVDATYKQYEEAFQLNTYLTNGNIGSETGGESQSGVNEQEAALIAFQLLKKAGAEDIDTYDSVKVQQAYDEYTKGRYTNKTDEEVKKILDRIAEYQGSYYDALKESYTSVTEIYKTLNEYEEYINDFEESLLKGLEEEINKEIDKQEKLNSALTDAFKDLLDEVKRRLDQRRQAEDNAKTESDIAKKQQRLATLQADTSGGHASEIKQLQQEIAEAQQNYGRTLEDQLLERLQQQGDEAAKQRERQIKLLEIQRDLAEALGTNLEEVKEWLQNPEANKEQIKAAWLTNQNYDEALPEQQKTLENQFEEAWTKYLAYGARAQDLRDFLDEVNFDNTPQEQAAQSLQKIETDLGGLKETIEKEVKESQAEAGEKSHNYINEVEEPTIDYGKISNFKENGVELEEARTKAENLGIDNSYASMREGGYTVEDFKKAGVSVSDALGAGFNHTQLKEGGYTAEDFKKSNLGAAEAAKAGFGYGDLIKGGYTYQDILDQQSEFEALAQANGGLKSDFIAQALAEQESEEIRKKEREQQKQIALRDVKYIAKQIDPNNPTGKKKKEMLLAWATNNNSFLKEFAGMAIPMKTGSGHINSNGQLYFNDKKGNVKRFNFTNGKFSNVKYNQKDWEKHAGYNQVSDTPYIMAEFQQALKKRNAKKYTKFTNKAPVFEAVPIAASAIPAYASGGMNYTTGPAWLDGTRAKPEAVLNATDTKNFIALKDILSDVMGHITDNNTTTYGDSTYEININVDHLNNDYDVDKVAKRVEKIITEDASYRNVTMVRKFR